MKRIPYQTAMRLRQQTQDGSFVHALQEAADDFGDDFSLLLAQYHELNKTEREGLTSFSDAKISRNRLRKSFLETIEERTEEQIEVEKEQPNHTAGSATIAGPNYLNHLADITWCHQLELYLIANQKNFSPMLENKDKKHILVYYYLQQQRNEFVNILKRTEGMNEMQSNYGLSVGELIQEIENILENLADVLNESQLVDHVLFRCRMRLGKQLTRARKTLIKTLKTDYDQEREKYKLAQIIMPQVKIELQDIIDQLLQGESTVEVFSRN